MDRTFRICEAMTQAGIQTPTRERPTPTEPTTTSRLRTVTGNRFPRISTADFGLELPGNPTVVS